jgi:3-hydroxyacyl-CoA dehydrogenase/enoyl-CoA hydratase/3-hydroxybutyryl-CoA epimerase
MAFFQSQTLWINQLSDGVAALVLDVPNRSVNVLTAQVLAELEQAIDRVAAEPSFRLLVIRSGKPGTFVAGADVRELAAIGSAADAERLSRRGQQLFAKLAALPQPSVAMIEGACLGGGLELALACDYRVVIDNPRTQLGLPEVELGLIPAWGGTQRLPRVVGLENGLQMILSGKRLKAEEALRCGLADAIVDRADEEPPAFLKQPVKRSPGKLPLRTWRQWLVESMALGRTFIYRGTKRILERKVPDDMPAPWEAFAAIRIGLQQGIDAGLAFESAAVGRLATSAASRNLIGLFLQHEEARKPRVVRSGDRATTGEGDALRRIGIVGAGVMGVGIAELAILKGCEVVIREVNEMALGMGMFRLIALLTKAVERGLLTAEQMQKRLANVHGTTAWKNFADLDLVVEAVVEDLAVKQEVFRELEKHTAPSTILATNTSSLRVADLSRGLQRPERVAGLHFFNPVHQMPLVEVVRTPATRPAVIDSMTDLVIKLGKAPVRVGDSPGFVVNRVLAPYFNEALLLVRGGMHPSLIDEALRRFGMPRGPLEVLDQVGLDVAAAAAQALRPVFGDRLPAAGVLEKMTAAGWLGAKSGQGFYRHGRGKPRVNDAAVTLARADDVAPGTSGTPSEEIASARERLVTLSVNEAALCVQEGLVESADALDLALVLGAGWAPHRGGPLHYARQRGVADIVASMQRLAAVLGPRFTPSAALQSLA